MVAKRADVRRSGVSEERQAYCTPPFGQIPAQIIFDQRVTPAMLRVYAALAVHADESRTCWPKQETLAKELGVARPNINRAIKNLVELGYVLKVRRKDDKGGDMNCTYRLTLPSTYQDDTPPVYHLDTPPVSAGYTPEYQDDTPITDQYRTERDSANALRTADADATPEPPASSQPSPAPAPAPAKTRKASRPRKLTDEQLEAHRIEQGYIADLLAAVKVETHTQALPMEGRERQAAHWFYRAHDGEPAPVADVMTCYRITKRGAFWRGKYLSLQHLEGCYVSYRADPAAYARDNPANGRRAPAASQPEPPSRPMRSVPPVNAKPAQLD